MKYDRCALDILDRSIDAGLSPWGIAVLHVKQDEKSRSMYEKIYQYTPLAADVGVPVVHKA